MAGVDTYRNGLRSAVRGLWSGALDPFDFLEAMDTTISTGLAAAWNEGAAEVGLSPDELTTGETLARDNMIFDEIAAVPDFSERIQEGSRANGGKLEPLLERVDRLWVLRWADAKNRAKQMASNDPKLTWKINQVRVVKENCATCLKLNGKTKRSSFWERSGIKPQSPPNSQLICQGWT